MKMKMMKQARILTAICAVVCAMTATAQKYATPEMQDTKGPFEAGLDFYMLSAAAPTGVSYIAGDALLYQQAGEMPLEFDVSKVKFGKQTFFEDYRAIEDNSEVEKIIGSSYNYFLAQLNQKNKTGLRIAKRGATVDSPYKLVIRLRKLDKGNASDFWFGFSAKGGGATVDGTIELTDAKTGQILCVHAFNHITGSNHATKSTRTGLAFSEVGRQLGKLVRAPKKK